MTFTRLISRNGLSEYRKGYDGGSSLHGDLLRFVENAQDHNHIAFFARITGATEDQIRQLLAMIFDDQRHITVNGMPLGEMPSFDGADAVEGLPSGADLTVSADRTRIAELETRIEKQDDTINRLLEAWRKESAERTEEV